MAYLIEFLGTIRFFTTSSTVIIQIRRPVFRLLSYLLLNCTINNFQRFCNWKWDRNVEYECNWSMKKAGRRLH